MVLQLTSGPQGVFFSVKVVPGASRNSVAGIEGAFLKVRLAAPPVRGKANQALIEFLSKLLAVSKSRVRIVKGISSRRKLILVAGQDAAQFGEFLSRLET